MYSSNKVASICKGISVIGVILGVIASVVLGKSATLGYGFSWVTFFTTLISVLFACFAVYAAGEVIDLLCVIAEQSKLTTAAVEKLVKHMNEATDSAPKKAVSVNMPANGTRSVNMPANRQPQSTGGSWTCTQCGYKNQSGARYCAACGKQH